MLLEPYSAYVPLNERISLMPIILVIILSLCFCARLILLCGQRVYRRFSERHPLLHFRRDRVRAV